MAKKVIIFFVFVIQHIRWTGDGLQTAGINCFTYEGFGSIWRKAKWKLKINECCNQLNGGRSSTPESGHIGVNHEMKHPPIESTVLIDWINHAQPKMRSIFIWFAPCGDPMVTASIQRLSTKISITRKKTDPLPHRIILRTSVPILSLKDMFVLLLSYRKNDVFETECIRL